MSDENNDIDVKEKKGSEREKNDQKKPCMRPNQESKLNESPRIHILTFTPIMCP